MYNGETLPILSKLDVAFEMDEVEILEEEAWDDNDIVIVIQMLMLTVELQTWRMDENNKLI